MEDEEEDDDDEDEDSISVSQLLPSGALLLLLLLMSVALVCIFNSQFCRRRIPNPPRPRSFTNPPRCTGPNPPR